MGCYGVNYWYNIVTRSLPQGEKRLAAIKADEELRRQRREQRQKEREEKGETFNLVAIVITTLYCREIRARGEGEEEKGKRRRERKEKETGVH